MEVRKITDMIGGWFIGDFEPSLFKTQNVEVALKEYCAGVYESKHYHKIATEYTVVVNGEIEMNGIHYKEGDIIVMYPNEETDFKSLTDSKCLVVKIPGAINDKYNSEL